MGQSSYGDELHWKGTELGRREKDLEPADGPVEAFAYELRMLRRKAGGITYREMAKRSEYSSTTLAHAASGEQLPSLPVVLGYVAACGGDAAEWESRWRETARMPEAVPVRDDDGGAAPYRGLARFDPDHHSLFFGRDRLIGQAVEFIHRLRFTALVGASGAGKSSLLRAGIIPALRASGPGLATVRLLTPGEQPYRDHAARLAPAPGAGDTLVVVDQFEELFTLCTDTEERNRFVSLLLGALEKNSQLRVVVAVRADFYDRLATHPALAAALSEATLLVGPMTPAELREAVVRPAAASGLLVERSLTARIVDEVTGEPGALPLMSHALLETWRRRHGRTLGETAYDAAGGLRGALAQTAETTYQGFDPAEKNLARQILLRLITPGEGAQDTRRPTDRAELPPGTAEILDHLARARLLTLDGTTVDLAHEALIMAWPRLRRWADSEREHLRVHRRLTEAAHTWDQLDREKGGLYRGTRLDSARGTFAEKDRWDGLTSLERDFLNMSSAEQEAERKAAERSTRRLRKLVSALSMLVVLTLTAAGIAYVQSHAARDEQLRAVREQQKALSRQLAAQSATLRDSDTDLAALLAVEAFRTDPTREATAALQTAAAGPLLHRVETDAPVAAVSFSPDGSSFVSSDEYGNMKWRQASDGRLKNEVSSEIDQDAIKDIRFTSDRKSLAIFDNYDLIHLIDPVTGKKKKIIDPDPIVPSIAMRPTGEVVLSGRDRQVRDGTTNQPIFAFAQSLGRAGALEISKDGRLLAAQSEKDGMVRIYEMLTGRSRATIDAGESVGSLIYLLLAPNGNTLAIGYRESRLIRLYDTKSGRLLAVLNGASDGEGARMSFSPDGKFIATVNDSKIILWEASSGNMKSTIIGHSAMVTSINFSPDGRIIASGDKDGVVRLWNAVPDQPMRTLKPSHPNAQTLAFSPDGKILAIAGRPGDKSVSIRLQNPQSGRIVGELNDTADYNHFYSMEFSPDGKFLIAGGLDGTHLWDIASRRLKRTPSRYQATHSNVGFGLDGKILDVPEGMWDEDFEAGLALNFETFSSLSPVFFSKDGKWLAIASGADVQVWNLITRKVEHVITSGNEGRAIVSFSPNGREVAIGNSVGTASIWSLDTGRPVQDIPRSAGLELLSFSPDGKILATAGSERTVRLWDLTGGELPATSLTHTETLAGLVFNSSGDMLATVTWSGIVNLWEVSSPDPGKSIKKICNIIRRDLTERERRIYLSQRAGTPVCPEFNETITAIDPKQ